MWTQTKFLDAFRRACEDLAATVERKNADYASGADPFANFRLIEAVSHGELSAEVGMIVRLTDKLARLYTLTSNEPRVADESFADTAYDLAAYGILVALLRRSRTEPDEPEPEAAEPAPTAIEQLKTFLAGLRQGA